MKLKESEDEDELEEESDESEDADADESEPVVAETDNVGDPSVEINVEELIHELEVQGVATARPGSEQAAKRRLEELMEKKRAKRELEDFEDYEI
jgi:hypothetical protein